MDKSGALDVDGVGDPDRLKLRKKEVRPDDDGGEGDDDCCPALGRYACALLLLLSVFCAIAEVVPVNEPGRFMRGDPTENAGEVGGSSTSSLPSTALLLLSSSTITPAAAA